MQLKYAFSVHRYKTISKQKQITAAISSLPLAVPTSSIAMQKNFTYCNGAPVEYFNAP